MNMIDWVEEEESYVIYSIGVYDFIFICYNILFGFKYQFIDYSIKKWGDENILL